MQVIYRVGDAEHTYVLQAEDDLRVICQEIEAHVRSEHPAVAGNLNLPIRIADGVLNGLADNSEEITLEDLAA